MITSLRLRGGSLDPGSRVGAAAIEAPAAGGYNESGISADPSDIRRGDWVERWLPARARPYARLARLDRPIGTWLLLFPGWWGIALAARAVAGSGADGAVRARRRRSCAAPAAPSTTSPTAITTRRSRAPGCGRCRAGRSPCAQAVVFLLLQLAVGAAVLFSLNRTSILLGVRGSRPDRHLSVHEADHLLAAGLSRPQFQLGGADRLDRGHRRARLAGRCCSISAASSGRSATTRSTRIRTRRMMSASASNPRPWRSAQAPAPGFSCSMPRHWRCGARPAALAGLGASFWVGLAAGGAAARLAGGARRHRRPGRLPRQVPLEPHGRLAAARRDRRRRISI